MLVLRLGIPNWSRFGAGNCRLYGLQDQVLRGDSRRDTLYFNGILKFDGHIYVPKVGYLI